MKKQIMIPLTAMGLLYAGLGLFNLAVPTAPADSYAAMAADTPQTERAKQIIGAKCIMCHSRSPALPFYAGLPGAKGFIQKHVKEGRGMMDLQELLAGTSTDRYAYNRLEHVITNDTMPIASYLALHWDGRLSKQEQQELLDWISQRQQDNL
jgi:cytochrome c peroxidase